MRAFAISTLVGITALNCLLAYSSEFLANEMRMSLHGFGIKQPGLTATALMLPPWFYAVAALALLVAGLGLWRRLREDKLVYSIVAFLAVDVGGLLWLLWGFTVVQINVGGIVLPK
jgi:glucose dehydrogenase